MNTITFTHQDKITTVNIDLEQLGQSIKQVETQIRAAKAILRIRHTMDEAPRLQQELALSLKPWATYCYILKSTLNGKSHIANLDSLALDKLLSYWIKGPEADRSIFIK